MEACFNSSEGGAASASPSTPAAPPPTASPSAPLPPLLAALGGQRPSRAPVWFMRQAGRSLPEYRALREREARGAGMTGMLGACLDPATAAEATLQPVRRHGVDAAILFSDIMVPLALAGVGVRIEPGVGPVVDHPVRTRADVAELTAHALGDSPRGPSGLAAIEEAVRAVVAELGAPGRPSATNGLPERALAGLAHSRGAWGWTPLIGFGGAPFTLAAYLVEGRPSRDHLAARTLMRSDAAAWDALLDWCARVTGEFIALQIRAGASAAQLFDSWAGALSPEDYRERVAPHSARALEIAGQALSPTTGGRVPLIHFGTGTARILADMRAAGAHAVGVDDRTSLAWAIEELGGRGACPVQGNLDPALLAAPWSVLESAIDACLEAGRAAPGHVLNLGHGVPPATDPGVLTRIVARAHGDEAWEPVALAGWNGWVGAPGSSAAGSGSEEA